MSPESGRTTESSADEYLGFAASISAREDSEPPVSAPEPASDDGDSYEDSWYQVLKAQAQEPAPD
jgi:hypothetical protein